MEGTQEKKHWRKHKGRKDRNKANLQKEIEE